MNLRQPLMIFWFMLSLFLLVLSVILAITEQAGSTIWLALVVLLLAQLGSTILFPMLVGYFYDKLRRAKEDAAIWSVFRDLADGGIIRVYKDREETPDEDNALNDLRLAFERVRAGEVKLVGVSLRVFFNQAGPFYRSIYAICSLAHQGSQIGMRALLSHPTSPEVLNRAAIESPNAHGDPLIAIDIRSTIASINNLNLNSPVQAIHYGFYKQAPYCTAIIFPDKCYFSPNLLSAGGTVRLPMIVFHRDSHAYRKLNEYFEYLWRERAPSETETREDAVRQGGASGEVDPTG